MFFCFFFSASACLGGRNQQSYDVGGKNSIFSLFFGTHTHLKKKGKNSLTVFFFITRGGSLFIGTLFVVADQVVYDNEDRGGRLSRTIDLLLFFFVFFFFHLRVHMSMSTSNTHVEVEKKGTKNGSSSSSSASSSSSSSSSLSSSYSDSDAHYSCVYRRSKVKNKRRPT